MKESLCRSRKNRIFGGVAAGLGEYLKMDPVIIRVLFVLSVFLSGLGIMLYIILWIVVPEENIFDKEIAAKHGVDAAIVLELIEFERTKVHMERRRGAKDAIRRIIEQRIEDSEA